MFRQMEKLIELLNEHGEYRWYWDDDLGLCIGWADNYENREYVDLEIISKKFGFIKWLVENEKIDYKKLPYSYIYHDDEGSWEKELLMQLAIQDEPIEFLISILK